MRVAVAPEGLRELFREGKFAELVARCKGIVRNLRDSEGPRSLEVAYALEDLGIAYLEMGDYAAAAEQLEHALGIENAVLGEVSEPCVATLCLLGRTYWRMGFAVEAETNLSRAMNIVGKLAEEKQHWRSRILVETARLHTDRKEYATAERLLLDAAKLRMRECGCSVLQNSGRLPAKPCLGQRRCPREAPASSRSPRSRYPKRHDGCAAPSGRHVPRRATFPWSDTGRSGDRRLEHSACCADSDRRPIRPSLRWRRTFRDYKLARKSPADPTPRSFLLAVWRGAGLTASSPALPTD